MDKDLLVAELSSVGFLRAAAAHQLERLARISQERRFPANTVIARQGEIGNSIYLVIDGTIALEICAPGAGCKRILTVGPGELLGWTPVLDPGGWTATARALSDSHLIEIEASQLRQLCDVDTSFGYEFMKRIAKALATRLNATRLQLVNLYGTQMADSMGGTSLDRPTSTQ